MTVFLMFLQCWAMAQQKQKRKKDKKRNPFVDYLAYVMLKLLVGLLYLIGVNNSLKLACFLGRKMWKHYHRGRDRALENLRNSFPEKDEQWINDIGQKSFCHVVMLAVDLLFTPKLVRKDNWRKYSRYINVERVKWMIKEHKGMLLLTAHYGNFEIMGYLLGLFGFDLYSIARPLDNPYINDWLYGVRQKKGQKIINKKGASNQMGEIVANGASLGFIADQDAGKKGVFADFFGRKASTYKSIGLVAMEYDLPIAVGMSRQEFGRFFFEIEVGRVIMPSEWKDKENPLEWITQEFSLAMEDLIRKDPSQYWWLHRRWKHRPKEERLAVSKESKQ